MSALLDAGVKVATANSKMLAPRTMQPMNTMVKEFLWNYLQTQASCLRKRGLLKALNSAGINTTIYPNFDYWNDNYNITVGLR